MYGPQPKYNYWPSYSDNFHFGPIEIAETETIALVIILSIVFGGAIVTVENTKLPNFIGGGVVAYVAGMIAIENVYQPSSPVHLVLYGVMLLCFITGAALALFVMRKGLLR